MQAMFNVYSLSQLPDEICKRIIAFVVKEHRQRAAILVKALYCSDCQGRRAPLIGWRTYAVREDDLSKCVMEQGPRLRSFPCASLSPLLFIRMMYRLCRSVDHPGRILIRFKDNPYSCMSFRAQRNTLYILYCKNGVDYNAAVDITNGDHIFRQREQQICQEDWTSITVSLVEMGNRNKGEDDKWVYCKVNTHQSVLVFRTLPWLYSLPMPISKQFRYAPAEQQENHLLKQVPAADLAAPFLGIIDGVPADVGVSSQDDIESEEEDFELRALRNISIRNRAIREYQQLIASATPLQQWRITSMLHDMMSPQRRREFFGPER